MLKQTNVLINKDVDDVAKWLASVYNLAPKEKKSNYVDALVIALEGASKPTREAIVEMLGITYTYPGGRTWPASQSAA